ncbi:unnamed protein product, partial [Polarella glacialis]
LLRRVLQERGRGVGGQVQRSEVVASGGKRACTEILSVVHKAGPQGEPVSIVEVRLHTGRLHQIRPTWHPKATPSSEIRPTAGARRTGAPGPSCTPLASRSRPSTLRRMHPSSTFPFQRILRAHCLRSVISRRESKMSSNNSNNNSKHLFLFFLVCWLCCC